MRQLRSSLASIADASALSLDGEQTRDALVQITALTSQLAELEARLLRQADVVGAAEQADATSTASWLAHATRMNPADARRKTRTAAALDLHEVTRNALAAGDLRLDQVRAILDGVDELPAEHRDEAETELVRLAATHNASELRALARHILEVVDPDRADAHEAELLDKQEREAERGTRLSMSDDGEGRTKGYFTIPTHVADRFRRILSSYMTPKHVRAAEGAGAYDHTRPTPQRTGKAFCELIESFPVDLAPTVGRTSATVVVHIPLDTLMGGLKAAELDTGTRISPGLARRIACQAGIIPVVLGGDSEVLDLGRTARYGSKEQRLAKSVTQRTCERVGCTVPHYLCHLHHKNKRWRDGGRTDLADLEFLCPQHHRWEHRRDPDPP